MTPIKVFTRDDSGSETVIAYSCSNCSSIWPVKSFHEEGAIHCASECCDHHCRDCGKSMAKESVGWLCCQDCRAKEEASKERRTFEKAEKIAEADHDGPVWWDTYGPQDGFFESTEDLREWCEQEDVDLPVWVHATERIELRLDAERIVDHEVEQHNHHEGAFDMCDIAGLQILLDEWAKKQGVVSYTEDSSRAVILDLDLE